MTGLANGLSKIGRAILYLLIRNLTCGQVITGSRESTILCLPILS